MTRALSKPAQVKAAKAKAVEEEKAAAAATVADAQSRVAGYLQEYERDPSASLVHLGVVEVERRLSAMHRWVSNYIALCNHRSAVGMSTRVDSKLGVIFKAACWLTIDYRLHLGGQKTDEELRAGKGISTAKWFNVEEHFFGKGSKRERE